MNSFKLINRAKQQRDRNEILKVTQGRCDELFYDEIRSSVLHNGQVNITKGRSNQRPQTGNIVIEKNEQHQDIQVTIDTLYDFQWPKCMDKYVPNMHATQHSKPPASFIDITTVISGSHDHRMSMIHEQVENVRECLF